MVLLKSSILNIFFIASYASTFHYGSIKIDDKFKLKISGVGSTFHYGSIKMVTTLCMLRSVSRSTFHYGSIKILLISVLTNLFTYLHSTMVLLKFCLYSISNAI